MGRLIRYDMSKVKDDAAAHLNARRFLGILNAAKYRLEEDVYKGLRKQALDGDVEGAERALMDLFGRKA